MPAIQTVNEFKLYKVTGVEIFSAGTWNGKAHPIEALHSMVTAFNALRPGFTPGLKLGHDEKQVVARASGLPACGWVENVYVRGDKLMADFDYVPEKVFLAIKSKAYRKVSCEVVYNLDLGTSQYSHVLCAVALLGNEMPGVLNLNDVLSLYSGRVDTELFAKIEKSATVEMYSQTFELNEETDMTAEELQKQLDAEKERTAALEAEKAEFTRKEGEREKEVAELREFRKTAEADKVKQAEALAQAKRESFVKDLETRKLATPASAKLVDALLNDKAEFELALSDKAEVKKFTRESAIEELLTLTVEASKVNFSESSLAGKDKGDKTDDTEEAIKSYMKENSCNYEKAYRAVMKEKSQKEGDKE